MLSECSKCGDPIYDYMSHCRRCGAPNESYVSDKRPTAAATEEQHAEAVLLGIGLLSLLAAGIFVLTGPGGEASGSFLRRYAPAPLAAVGVGALVAYHRLDLRQWSSGKRMVLWVTLGILWSLALVAVAIGWRGM